MKVKELIKQLKEMSPNADVFVITANGDYQKVIDCEEEFSDLVSLGCENERKNRNGYAKKL